MSDYRTPQVKRFQLSQNAIAEIAKALGKSKKTAVVTKALQTLIQVRRSQPIADSIEMPPALDQLLMALRLVIRRIDQFEHEQQQRPTIFTLGEVASFGKSRRLPVLRQNAENCLRMLQPFGSRRGRRRHHADRDDLSIDVAILLRLNGFTLTTSRGGPFATVLAAVFADVYGKAPQDPFRLVQNAAAFVHDMSDDELKRSVLAIAKVSPSGPFWVSFLREPVH